MSSHDLCSFAVRGLDPFVVEGMASLDQPRRRRPARLPAKTLRTAPPTQRTPSITVISSAPFQTVLSPLLPRRPSLKRCESRNGVATIRPRSSDRVDPKWPHSRRSRTPRLGSSPAQELSVTAPGREQGRATTSQSEEGSVVVSGAAVRHLSPDLGFPVGRRGRVCQEHPTAMHAMRCTDSMPGERARDHVASSLALIRAIRA